MKLPKSKKKELAKEGKPESPPVPLGGAMGRLRQFQEQRGIQDDADLSNPAAKKPAKAKQKARTSRKK